MFFGLSNTKFSFQSYINKILVKKLDVISIVYLDNILNYITKKDHINLIVLILK